MICTGEAVKPAKARELGLVFDVVPSERLERGSPSAAAWSAIRRLERDAGVKKQQPVGLTEEQAIFTFAVGQGPGAGQDEGPVSRPPWPPSMPSPRAATCRSTKA